MAVVPTQARHARRTALLAKVVTLAVVALLGGCGYGDPSAAPPPDAPSTTAASIQASTTTATSTSVVTTSSTVPPMDLQTADLKGGSYQVLCPGGPVSASPAAGTTITADGRRAVIDRFEAQFSDVTGDGWPDAVVTVHCRADADGTPGSDSVIVLTASGNVVKQLGQPIEGTEPTVVGQSIAVRQVTASDSAGQTAAPTTSTAQITGSTQPGAAPATVPASAEPAPTVRYGAFSYSGEQWTPAIATVDPQMSAKHPVTTEGLDPYLVGTPFGEIALTSGQPVDVTDSLRSNGACVNVTYPLGPSEISSLGSDGSIRSLEIRNSTMRTAEGIGVGSSEADVTQAYAGGITVMDNPASPGGHLLVVRIGDAPDRTMMFTTDGSVVIKYAVGQAGWADVLKGCS